MQSVVGVEKESFSSLSIFLVRPNLLIPGREERTHEKRHMHVL